jgi:hypothetical protein
MKSLAHQQRPKTGEVKITQSKQFYLTLLLRFRNNTNKQALFIMPRKLIDHEATETKPIVIDREELSDSLEILKAMKRGEDLSSNPKLKPIVERVERRAAKHSRYSTSLNARLFVALMISVIGWYILNKRKELWNY